MLIDGSGRTNWKIPQRECVNKFEMISSYYNTSVSIQRRMTETALDTGEKPWDRYRGVCVWESEHSGLKAKNIKFKCNEIVKGSVINYQRAAKMQYFSDLSILITQKHYLARFILYRILYTYIPRVHSNSVTSCMYTVQMKTVRASVRSPDLFSLEFSSALYNS